MEQQVPLVQGATGIQEQPKPQRSPRKKKNSEWTLNQKQFDHSKTQEISHILPGEHVRNVLGSMERNLPLNGGDASLGVKRTIKIHCFLGQKWYSDEDLCQ